MNRKLAMIAALELGVFLFCSCSVTKLDILDRKWHNLCKAGGDLAGGQHWSEDGLAEESVLLNSDWQAFLQQPPEKTVPFLIGKLGVTNAIAVEVSPWGKTSEGAMALFAMQQILQINWTDCPPSFAVLRKYAEIVALDDRNVVPFLLPVNVAREEMKQFWQQTFAEKKEALSHPPAESQ